jgi:integrase
LVAISLTKRAVDALAPGEKTYFTYDGKLPGFGLCVRPSGVKTFVFEYRAGAGGRSAVKRRLTLGRYGPMTVEQAREAALDASARVRLGADPHTDKTERRAALCGAELIDLFLAEHVRPKLKRGTFLWFQTTLVPVRKSFGTLKAEALTRTHVAALHRDMAETPSQANRMLAAVSSLYAWAERQGHVPEGFANPARKIAKYREQGRERFLTGEELARLGDTLRLAETDGLPYAVDEGSPNAKHAAKPENRRVVLDPFAVAAIRLLILTGARLREILHARLAQIDFERGILFLSDSKTGRKPIYLNAPALEVLASLPRIEGNPHIIPGAKEGQPRHDLKKPWDAVCKAAGLAGLRLHDLRHSHASVGAGAGLSLPLIGKLLGHSQAATTQRYAHLANDPVRAASETIGATIKAALDSRNADPPKPLRAAK